MAVVDVSVDAVIPRPVEEVAEFAADPSNAPSWYANIESVEWLSPPPPAVGSAGGVRGPVPGPAPGLRAAQGPTPAPPPSADVPPGRPVDPYARAPASSRTDGLGSGRGRRATGAAAEVDDHPRTHQHGPGQCEEHRGR